MERNRNKGELLEKNWLQIINKKSKIINELNKFKENQTTGLGSLIQKEKENFEDKPSLATRQCSMAAIEKISAFLPQLIGNQQI